MKNFLVNKDKHLLNFADVVYADFLKVRFGLASCRATISKELVEMRKELVDWQQNEDGGALTQTSISYVTWLGVNYDLDEIENSNVGIGYLQSPCPIGPTNLGLTYNYGNAQSQNIVEVNSGGCMTRINLNPTININTFASPQFTFVQETDANVWVINHNLGMVPNVFIQDPDGNDMEGLVEPINQNTITITFSAAVSGTAFLS